MVKVRQKWQIFKNMYNTGEPNKHGIQFFQCMLSAHCLYSCTAHKAMDCKALRLAGCQWGPVGGCIVTGMIRISDMYYTKSPIQKYCVFPNLLTVKWKFVNLSQFSHLIPLQTFRCIPVRSPKVHPFQNIRRKYLNLESCKHVIFGKNH